MAHLNTDAGEHDHTVSFFIVRTDFDEPRLTLHVHRKTGKLSMFGGHVERNENPWQAVLREVTEETGYLHEQLCILQPAQRLTFLTDGVVHPVPVGCTTGRYPRDVPHFHSDTMHALLADSAPAGAPAPGESTDIRLFAAAELREVPAGEIVEMWREYGHYILDIIVPNWHRLPLTAFSLQNPGGDTETRRRRVHG